MKSIRNGGRVGTCSVYKRAGYEHVTSVRIFGAGTVAMPQQQLALPQLRSARRRV